MFQYPFLIRISDSFVRSVSVSRYGISLTLSDTVCSDSLSVVDSVGSSQEINQLQPGSLWYGFQLSNSVFLLSAAIWHFYPGTDMTEKLQEPNRQFFGKFSSWRHKVTSLVLFIEIIGGRGQKRSSAKVWGREHKFFGQSRGANECILSYYYVSML